MSKQPTITALWFNAKGYGPDEFELQLQPLASDLDGAIPATLGIRVRVHPDGIVIGAHQMIDGGFMLSRDDVAELHRQLGAWLEGDGK